MNKIIVGDKMYKNNNIFSIVNIIINEISKKKTNKSLFILY